ncbi:DUF4381 domain-containing protein [Vibrio maerlii]|uniref:DUF4381 domain-containing protein n=1 Tax=Vibrio maerlii TaxID=2231648 RepID=UPI000E3C21ED|nr:DUF4381 domain-containing protein [Vibrio maerlii]
MSNNSLLEHFIDPLSPTAISWMPQTTGWKVVAVAFCLLVSFWCYRTWLEFKQQGYRREAIRQLKQLTFDCQVLNEPQITLQQLNQIAKHTAMQAYPNLEIASVYDRDWLEVLDRTCNEIDFKQPLFVVWQRSLYNPAHENWDSHQLNELIDAIHTWVKHHTKELK